MPVRLTDRDRAILEHVGCHRITTIEVLSRRFFPDGSDNAVSKVLERLKDYLQPAYLFGSRKFYYLTPKGANLLGRDDDLAKPPRTQALARLYSLLVYCCLNGDGREYVTSDEFKRDFPDYDFPGVPRHSYYMETSAERPRLGWLEVDYGGQAAKRARKCLDQYRKRVKYPRFRNLSDAGRFVLTLATSFELKKDALTKAFERLEPFPVEVIVVEELRDIILREGVATRSAGGRGDD